MHFWFLLANSKVSRSFLMGPFTAGRLFIFGKLKPLYYFKKFSWRQNLHTAKGTCFLGTTGWIFTEADNPGARAPGKRGSISISPERSLEATLFLNYWHLNVFAWRLSKPNVRAESLIINHPLQTQVVKALETGPAPARTCLRDGRFN